MNHDFESMISEGALFFVSHSGGKDSQAMYDLVITHVPFDQIVVVHADLGEIEHQDVQEHIHRTTQHPLHVVHAIDKHGNTKDLLTMIEDRADKRPDSPAWPSSSARYCTSDLKRGPIEKQIRGVMAERGVKLAVNCMGLRAEESPNRAKMETWKLNTRLSKAGRQVFDWLPIHDWSTEQVFDRITAAGQEPHRVYLEGNERLSCVFCIFGSDNDLRNGARLRPALARDYIELERRIGKTMFHKASLESRIGDLIPVRQIQEELFA